MSINHLDEHEFSINKCPEDIFTKNLNYQTKI